ncbi:MAG: glutamine-hydrolyzing GMP synthase [Kosmotoga sp.]|uniref:glutamine-hydrolyzing GMP synthase n=1 Tax=Kosmotoga sp. TaxID=1955248 RepID=UPI001D4ADC65|nr:glutamine-hydrolyzing GMP synthase [Kosmotoga sp.]MBO8166864.1 glutamine-hydrolyzing GMP synthase [Kosmotoga sp.]
MKKIVVVDYGSQYTQLIARRLRELEVYSEVIHHTEDTSLEDVVGVILSGGPNSVTVEGAPDLPNWFQKVKVPVMGICYGMQLLVKNFGGKVDKTEAAEYGRTEIRTLKCSSIFENVPRNFNVWMSHGDSVVNIPENFDVLAETENNIPAALCSKDKRIWTLQFHPEVRHTEHGMDIIENFLFNICRAERSWTMEKFLEEKISEIRETVGDSKTILGLSGGVDSSVAAVLVHKAIGKRLINIFVDHGLLRLNEEQEVPNVFRDKLGLNLDVVHAKDRFLNRLQGVTEPEEKRKIIGKEFIRVFEKEAKRVGGEFLVQGTIYSDVIESAASGKETAKIKSHHNVGGLPEKMNLKIIEPLRYLFKDEVRKLGELLGIPHEILYRHPFPGPGLGIRIIGEITEEKLNILKEADAIFIRTLKEKGWYERIWQAFAVLLSSKSVGVVGDERAYDYVIALRAVNSVEGMTADWSKIPHEILDEISRRICNSVKGAGRVVYDITSKPPATIEWE